MNTPKTPDQVLSPDDLPGKWKGQYDRMIYSNLPYYKDRKALHKDAMIAIKQLWRQELARKNNNAQLSFDSIGGAA